MFKPNIGKAVTTNLFIAGGPPCCSDRPRDLIPKPLHLEALSPKASLEIDRRSKDPSITRTLIMFQTHCGILAYIVAVSAFLQEKGAHMYSLQVFLSICI